MGWIHFSLAANMTNWFIHVTNSITCHTLDVFMFYIHTHVLNTRIHNTSTSYKIWACGMPAIRIVYVTIRLFNATDLIDNPVNLNQCDSIRFDSISCERILLRNRREVHPVSASWAIDRCLYKQKTVICFTAPTLGTRQRRCLSSLIHTRFDFVAHT